MLGKPLIGITIESIRDTNDTKKGGLFQQPWNYSDLVARAGGVPIILPATTDANAVAAILDGWLMPGGEDIDASAWGEPNHSKAKPSDGTRFGFEKALFAEIPPDLPILGICYGSQCLNVLHGGSLEQHLPDRVDHDEHAEGVEQRYSIEQDSRLGALVGTAARGKSYHHQAVARVGAGLRVNARHADGTVEGVEVVGDAWRVGVQWHPERTPGYEETIRIFDAFIAAATNFRRRR